MERNFNAANQELLNNMKFYILSGPVQETAARKAAEELEEKLWIAQQAGKTFEAYYGMNPKRYCDDLLSLLPKRTMRERLRLFIFGFLFLVQWSIADGIRGTLTVSLYDLGVSLGAAVLTISTIWVLMRRTAFWSKKAFFWSLFFSLAGACCIYVGLMRSEELLFPAGPRIEFNGVPAYVLGAIGITLIIVCLYWSIFRLKKDSQRRAKR